MNNLMSNFSGLALSRMEMKKVTGGCSAQGSNGQVTTCSQADCQAIAADSGGHWCCASCGSASWVNHA